MQEYEQTLEGMLLMPMLRPIRLDGTGPNAIILFYLSINFESIPFENGAIFYFKAVLVEHLHLLKNPAKRLAESLRKRAVAGFNVPLCDGVGGNQFGMKAFCHIGQVLEDTLNINHHGIACPGDDCQLLLKKRSTQGHTVAL